MTANHTALVALASCSALTLAFATAAHAQTAARPAAAKEAPATVGELVVTAQKREERLQDVPQSVAVASQAQLERQQVNQIADLARVTPSLEIQQAPGQSVGGGGQVRGIGTQSFQQGAVGSVGVVVDQVSQGNANISDLFDVARVEVLKGPQGTLFGLTTSAGVINITTNAPKFGDFSGRVRTELSKDGTLGSQYGQQIVQGVVNVPIADNAAARISASVNRRQGVDRNALTGDLDDHASYSLRGRLLWQPTDKLTVNLIGDASRIDDDGVDFFVVYKADARTVGMLSSCGITASEGNRSYCQSNGGYSKGKNYGLSGQLDYDAGPLTFTSITQARHQDIGPNLLNIFRLQTSPLQILSGPTNGDVDLFTQEFRLASPTGSRLEYTVGAFFSYQKAPTKPVPFSITATPAPGVVIPIVNSQGTDLDAYNQSAALFGQATAHLTDQLRLVFGARETTETLKVNQRSLDTRATGNAKAQIDNFSWRIGPQYEFNRDLMAYATISRGYKGPQIALNDPSVPGSVATVIRPEIPTNYEAGLKATMFEGRVLADVSAFYMRLKDYQGQLCTPNANGGLNCVPQNIGKVVSKGAELNLFGSPMNGLSFNAGLLYNPVTYPAGFRGQDGSQLGGLQLASAPKWKLTLSGEYSHEVSNGLEAFIGGDAVYKSALRLAASTDPNLTFGSHWLLGGRVGVRNTDRGWSAALFVRNAGNSHEPVVRYANFPDTTASYGQILTPQSFRLVGVSLDASF